MYHLRKGNLSAWHCWRSSRTRKLFQHISSNANSDQLSIVTSIMSECNMGFFSWKWKRLFVILQIWKKKWVKYIFAKNNCIIFSKFSYHNCANCKLRKTSKQLLVIFHNKFPYKRCILCFNLILMCCPVNTYPPRHFIYLLPITTTRKRIRNGVDVVVHLVASREKRHELWRQFSR